MKGDALGSRLADEEKLLPWFYSILNNAITDLYRRQQVETRSLQQIAREQLLEEEPEAERVLCECFRDLIPPSSRNMLS